ncbi:MAG: 2Fe-2S iron-sulfur cluster-binding protein [Lachnospiraceae bacterium]
MYNIQIKQTGKSLLESLIAEDVFVENPCNGRGLCGKCKVRILEGRCTPIQESEARLLTPEEIQLGIRLACIAEPLEDLVVEVLQKEREHKVLTTGYRPEFVFHPKAINYGIAVDIGTTTYV